MINYLKIVMALLIAGLSNYSFGQQIDVTIQPPTRCPVYDLTKKPGGLKALQAYQDYLQYSRCTEIVSENGPMGILLLTAYKNAENKDCWQMECCYDDRDKDVVPIGYFFQRSGRFRLILVYAGNERGEKINSSLASLATTRGNMACFEEVVGNRVYLRPPRQQRITQILGKTTDMWVVDRVNYTGDVYHTVLFVFEPDGMFKATYF